MFSQTYSCLLLELGNILVMILVPEVSLFTRSHIEMDGKSKMHFVDGLPSTGGFEI